MQHLTRILAGTLYALMLTPTVVAQQPADLPDQMAVSSMAGSYHSAGVMETASQLLLQPDGSYKWMLIVGSLDLYSKGKWTQANGQVILGPHIFDPETPVFVLDQGHEWDEQEVDAAYDQENIRLKNRAMQQCTFLVRGGYSSSSDDLHIIRNLPPSQRFETAKKRESELRTAYEKAISAYFLGDRANQNDGLEIAARTARQDWENAVAFLAETGRVIGQTVTYQPPALPVDCIFLSDNTPENWYVENGEADINWRKGVGIWINRRHRPNAQLNVTGKFLFTDGSSATANSYELGFAFVPRRDEQQLQSITLTLRHDETDYVSKFDIDPDNRQHAYTARVNPSLFIKPPFAKLTLNISGDKLMMADGSSGYYVRTK